MLRRILSFGIAFLLSVSAYAFSDSSGVSIDLFKNLRPRNIGPANMGGRITDIEGIPGNPGTVYVATATGGLWKTTNWGIRWTPLFDEQETTSIGDIALDPQNPDVIWVGTGAPPPAQQRLHRLRRLQVHRRRQDLAVSGAARDAPD
jgi:hypothetical protein